MKRGFQTRCMGRCQGTFRSSKLCHPTARLSADVERDRVQRPRTRYFFKRGCCEQGIGVGEQTASAARDFDDVSSVWNLMCLYESR